MADGNLTGTPSPGAQAGPAPGGVGSDAGIDAGRSTAKPGPVTNQPLTNQPAAVTSQLPAVGKIRPTDKVQAEASSIPASQATDENGQAALDAQKMQVPGAQTAVLANQTPTERAAMNNVQRDQEEKERQKRVGRV